MASEPEVKRAIAFVDGQNLYHGVKKAFGYSFPNFDPVMLAAAVCQRQGWCLEETRFYTGVPDYRDDRFWHGFWANKLARLGRQPNVRVYSRSLRYRDKVVELPDGSQHKFRTGEEKGIDVRIALDVITLAYDRAYDVALIFSQDQDLSEAAHEIRRIARKQDRWIKVASAFPVGPGLANRKGIDRSDWVPIDKTLYDSCIDPRDYRPKQR